MWQQLAKLHVGIIPRKYAANGEKLKQIGREQKVCSIITRSTMISWKYGRDNILKYFFILK